MPNELEKTHTGEMALCSLTRRKEMGKEEDGSVVAVGQGRGGVGDRCGFRVAKRSDSASPTASMELCLEFRGLQKSFCMSRKKLPSKMFSVRHNNWNKWNPNSV